jgi:hypothetical protein
MCWGIFVAQFLVYAIDLSWESNFLTILGMKCEGVFCIVNEVDIDEVEPS